MGTVCGLNLFMDRRRWLWAFTALVVGCLACSQFSRGGIEPTPTSISGEENNSILSTVEDAGGDLPPTGEQPVTPTPPMAAPLPAVGPWGLAVGNDGVWAFNPDGTGAGLLARLHILAPANLETAAGAGGRLALITAGADGWSELALVVVSLPEGQVNVVTSLLPAGAVINDQSGAPLLQTARLIRGGHSLAWSPNGQRLAFTSAQNGGSARLFIYSLAEKKIDWLAGSPSLAYAPVWSPDGRFIAHLVAAPAGGNSLAVAGVWLADVTGGSDQLLYQAGSAGEEIVAWVSPQSFLVYSQQADCGAYNLRTLDIITRQAVPLWPGYFSNLARDPTSGAMFISVNQSAAACGPAQQAGIFRLLPGGIAERTLEISGGELSWSPASGLFYVLANEGLFAFTPSGQDVSVAAGLPFLPVDSPGGRYSSWAGGQGAAQKGLWVGSTGAQPQRVFTGEASGPSWAPDGKTLFFFSRGELYIAAAPSFTPRLLAGNIQPPRQPQIVWLRP
jgi:hypothetical protein